MRVVTSLLFIVLATAPGRAAPGPSEPPAAEAAGMAATPAASAPAGAFGGEAVRIPSRDTTLTAALFRPDGAGPFPAVVALHGCGGLAKESLDPRYRDWAKALNDRGFVVLFPDSFGSRGLGSQCRVRARSVTPERERTADADAARRWLQAQSYVRADRISLLGWSNGGSSVLWAVRPQSRTERSSPDFRSAVAFYPGCARLVPRAWSARVPTLVLIGGADDWTPAAACEQMVAGARGRSALTAIEVYPGAYHDFDAPDRPVRLHTGLTFSADGSGRAHSGTNPAARADAFQRAPAWLAR
ncbi:MAG: dienelactone hydrolase family protein [Rhodoplanes sp.]|nr:dienelactone hydrolase family protein [Rhodoplanes sp.]